MPIREEQVVSPMEAQCACHQVTTGYCRSIEYGMLSGFCAVSTADCPPTTHVFVSSYDLSTSSKDLSGSAFVASMMGLSCRLCPNTQVVMGSCVDSVTRQFLGCALEAQDCVHQQSSNSGGDPDLQPEFVSAWHAVPAEHQCVLTTQGRVGECRSTQNDEDSNLSSFCTSPSHDDNSCPTGYQHSDTHVDHCTILADTTTGMPTTYGSCTSSTTSGSPRHRCVWDKSECDPKTEVWQPPSAPNKQPTTPSTNKKGEDGNADRQCWCEDVSLGACGIRHQSLTSSNSMVYHCAVSTQACDDPTTYVPSYQVAANPHLYLTIHGESVQDACALCPPGAREPFLPHVTTTTATPTESPNTTTTTESVLDNPLVTERPEYGSKQPSQPSIPGPPNDSNNLNSSGTSATTTDNDMRVSGGVVFGLIGLVVIMTLLFLLFYRRRRITTVVNDQLCCPEYNDNEHDIETQRFRNKRSQKNDGHDEREVYETRMSARSDVPLPPSLSPKLSHDTVLSIS